MRSRSAIAAIAFVVLGGQFAVVQADVVIETVTVGNPGNDGENSGQSEPGGYGPNRICGAVDYVYSIGKFEVTAGQYTEFLNAVADEDTYGLFHTDMWDYEAGCRIERTGESPDYSYSVAQDWADRPVNYVSWGDAARFANWLHNGQPTGPQNVTTTEDGSYYLNGATTDGELTAIVRKGDATWVIPSEDEWYKAAYHYNDGVTGNYWDFPTASDMPPTTEAPAGTDMTNGSANYFDWYGGNDYAVGSPYYRSEVGAYDAKPSDSPYGTFDQGGNVAEWNEAVHSVLHRGHRGGSSSDPDYYLHAAQRIHLHYATYEASTTGFRVADASAECGNGVIEFSEECDDGGADDGNGCSSTCAVEPGWDCSGQPSMCTSLPSVLLLPDPPHDAKKNRYLSIDTTTTIDSEVALQVELVSMRRCSILSNRACTGDDDCGPAVPGSGTCVEHPDVGTAGPWWVQAPQQEELGCLPGPCGDQDWFARVDTVPFFDVWTLEILHIGDCQMVPVATYEVRACLPPDGTLCGDPLTIGTIGQPFVAPGFRGNYGDVVGPVEDTEPDRYFTPPDRFVNVVDVSAYILTKQNYGTANKPQTHPTWVDLHGLGDGNPPQYILGVSDLQQILKGFSGDAWTDDPGNMTPGQCP